MRRRWSAAGSTATIAWSLYRTKTGNAVTVLLPPHVAQQLRNVPPGLDAHPDYFFWSGNGQRNKAASTWQKALRRLWTLVTPPLDLRDRRGKRIRPKSHMKVNLPGVVEINPQGGKIARMFAAAAEWQAGDWYVDRNAAWTEPFWNKSRCFRTPRTMTWQMRCRRLRRGCCKLLCTRLIGFPSNYSLLALGGTRMDFQTRLIGQASPGHGAQYRCSRQPC
jgi:hypothetical protein